MAVRMWNQEIEVERSICTLHLWHPDGRRSIHWFSTRLLEEVSTLNWYEISSKHAAAHLRGGELTKLHYLSMNKREGEGYEFHIDHINGNPRDSRDVNLRKVPQRINHHNPNNQNASPDGYCIQARGKSFRVHVSFSQHRIFTPSFSQWDRARRCRDLYLELAMQYDLGKISKPSKEQLQLIAREC